MIKTLGILLLLIFSTSCKNESNAVSLLKASQLLELSLVTLETDSISWIDIKNQKATVFIFLSPLCPIVQKSIHRVKEIYREFHPQQVSFYGVFPGSLSDKKEAKNFKSEYQLDFDILKDPEMSLQKLLGATTSPEVFVIDQKGKVRYQGQIDNWFFALGKKRSVVTENYLSDALQAIIDGKPIRQKRTKAVGCYLPRK